MRQVLEIVESFQGAGLVRLNHSDIGTEPPIQVTTLRVPALRGFHLEECHVGDVAQSALDFAPGDFVQLLTPDLTWAVAQVNDVVESPWHQLKVRRSGISRCVFQCISSTGWCVHTGTGNSLVWASLPRSRTREYTLTYPP